MPGYVKRIKFKIPHLNKEVDIKVNGKTLILTGANGCGKTQLIKAIFKRLTHIVNNDEQIEQIEQLVRSLRQRDDSRKHQKILEEYEQKLKTAKNSLIQLDNVNEFIVGCNNYTSILLIFEAMRKSDIIKPISVASIDSLRAKETQSSGIDNEKVSSMFEEFLVANIANQAFSESKKIKNNPEEAKRIELWFNKLECDLQNLFEDKLLRLKFNSDSFTFSIHQPDKCPYTLQTLSSGFSSIMSIYADLITRVSLRSIDPKDLTGIVLIDEIDAHLHVSLQKKILTFFTGAFPKVQFIITTHSPFVVSSIDNAVIYDLSTCQQVEDLSMYSYESVLEGIFRVLPISTLLEDQIKFLSKLLKNSPLDISKIEALLKKLPEDKNVLDEESLYFVKSAFIAISKAKRQLDV